jgi:hypothetical protein
VFELEVALRARADKILAFLGVEDRGNPGLERIAGRVFVDADAEDEVLRALWDETVLRSPVTRSLVGKVPIEVEFRRQ